VVTQLDYARAIRLIEKHVGFRFTDIPDIKDYVLAGQALASALMVIKGMSKDLVINDLDLFTFKPVNQFKARQKNFFMFNRIVADAQYRKNQYADASVFDEKADKLFEFLIKQSPQHLPEQTPDYYHSMDMRSAVDNIRAITSRDMKVRDAGVNSMQEYQPEAVLKDLSQREQLPVLVKLKKQALSSIKSYLYTKASHYSTAHYLMPTDGRNATNIRILNSVTEGIINKITFAHKDGNHQGARHSQYHLTEKLIGDFDFNIVQTAYLFDKNYGMHTLNFAEFVRTKQMRITHCMTPHHTTVRYFKKRNEFIDDCYFQTETDVRILNQALLLCDDKYREDHFSKSEGIIHRPFGKGYEKKVCPEMLNYFQLNPTNSNRLFHVQGRTIDDFDWVRKETQLDKLNVHPNSGSRKFYPRYLTCALPSLVYPNKIDRIKRQLIKSLPDTFSSKDYIKMMHFTNTQELRQKIYALLPLDNDVHSFEKIIQSVHQQLGTQLDFVYIFVAQFLVHFPQITYQQTLSLVRILCQIQTNRFIGYLENTPIDTYVPQNTQEHFEDYLQHFENTLIGLKKDYDSFNSNEQTMLKGFGIRTYGSIKIQHLRTSDQLEDEGDEMRHCVGGYTDQLKGTSALFFSLKGINDTPRLTFDFSLSQRQRWHVGQIQCKGNGHLANQSMHYPQRALDAMLQLLKDLTIEYNINFGDDVHKRIISRFMRHNDSIQEDAA
jgi:hypothetical protein